jgi:NADH dehydrogenase
VIDRRNYHLFQPLLYQVATAGLSPAQIASPIRAILRQAVNISVTLGRCPASIRTAVSSRSMIAKSLMTD